MGFFDVLFGTPQSLYASYAIIAAIITICVTVILIRTDITVGNRFLFVFLVILMLIPSVVLTLFQLTCIVTGGTKDDRWWCWLYAWIVSVFIIIYCIFVIIIAFMTLFNYNSAINKVEVQEKLTMMNPEDALAYAQNLMNVEHFTSGEDTKIPKPIEKIPVETDEKKSVEMPMKDEKKHTPPQAPPVIQSSNNNTKIPATVDMNNKKEKFVDGDVTAQDKQEEMDKLLNYDNFENDDEDNFESFTNFKSSYSKY